MYFLTYHNVRIRLNSSQILRSIVTSALRNDPECILKNIPCGPEEIHITCAMIPGDGVGPELMQSVKTVFKAAAIPMKFVTYSLHKDDDQKVSETIEAVKKWGVCLKSAYVADEPTTEGEFQNLNVKLRTVLDVYANVAHIMSVSGIKTRHADIDLYIIREQTESSYINLEHESVKGVVECLKVVTAVKSRRIAKFAFDFATKHNRRTVTCIHKANIMKLGDGLFLRSCQEIAKLYPKIKFDKMIVDNTMMQLVSNPQQFDVLLTPNLYGNIADNLGAGLVGGAGVVPGASYAANCVVFEPAAHHTFIEGAGKNIANPTAMLLCASKLLYHTNLRPHAYKLRNAVLDVLKEGKVRTFDIGGKSSTTDFTQAVIDKMK